MPSLPVRPITDEELIAWAKERWGSELALQQPHRPLALANIITALLDVVLEVGLIEPDFDKVDRAIQLCRNEYYRRTHC